MRGEHERFLSDRVLMLPGDCLDKLPDIEADSLDSCVTDPPYGLNFMGKHWDHGVPGVDYWRAVFRVLKPGAHLLAFGGTVTYHRLGCAIEDAGFEIRDMVQWLYGSGMPKGINVGKAIDGEGPYAARKPRPYEGGSALNISVNDPRQGHPITLPGSPEAQAWDGWNTGLKPACEPIVLARKPLSEPTVVENVLRWGVGALNIGACRVASGGEVLTGGTGTAGKHEGWDRPWMHDGTVRENYKSTDGRWPANVIHDGSDEVVDGFPMTTTGNLARCAGSGEGYGFKGRDGIGHMGDSGSAARFFYSSKADDGDRLGSDHPTVKPVDLMQYLCRLVTPPGGLILDSFAGTGSTGEAAWREGFRCILIEREPAYQDHIRQRMALAGASVHERKRAVVEAKVKRGRLKVAAMPLFETGEAHA
jgi:DNA modification methylase